MCYAYYREQSAARKDSTETPATTPLETATPAAEPAPVSKQAEEKAYSSFIEKVQHLLAAQKRRETTPV